jgi:hypothetical protein
MAFHQAKVCAADWDFSNTISPAFKPSHGNDLSLPFTGCQYSASDQTFGQISSRLAPARLQRKTTIK